MKKFRALLWKEWRQTRALFVALAIGGPLFMGAAWAYRGHRPEEGRAWGWRQRSSCSSPRQSSRPGPSQASAARTLAFLLEAPVARWKVVAAKALVGAVLSAGAGRPRRRAGEAVLADGLGNPLAD